MSKFTKLYEATKKQFIKEESDYPEIKKLSKNPSAADYRKDETYTVYNPDTNEKLTSSITRQSANDIVAKYPELKMGSSAWVSDNIKSK